MGSASGSNAPKPSTAYDLLGRQHPVVIIDGKTYLQNGDRLPIGWTVDAGGAIYQMGFGNLGVKVDSHNRYVDNTDQPAGGGGGGNPAGTTNPWWSNIGPISVGETPPSGTDVGASIGKAIIDAITSASGTVNSGQVGTDKNSVTLPPLFDLMTGKGEVEVNTTLDDSIKKYGLIAGGALLILILLKGVLRK